LIHSVSFHTTLEPGILRDDLERIDMDVERMAHESRLQRLLLCRAELELRIDTVRVIGTPSAALSVLATSNFVSGVLVSMKKVSS